MNTTNIGFERGRDPKEILGVCILSEIYAKMIKCGWNSKFFTISRALCWAAASGYNDYVKYLLNSGANTTDSNHFALRYACFYEFYETVDLLLDAGANIDYVINWLDRTPDHTSHKLKNYIRNNKKGYEHY